MTERDEAKSAHRRWAEFRYSVVGPLFAAPPDPGALAKALRGLSEKTWKHPLTGKPMQIGFSTIETWYYAAKKERRDPVGRLRSKTRSDVGKSRCLSAENITLLKEQYQQYPSWTYQLHADNLRSSLSQQNAFDIPSYPSVRRFMKMNGLRKQRKPRNDSDLVAINRVQEREVRSYEVEFVNALWHLDYHSSPLKVVTEDGRWHAPILAGIFDDHSRLACHMQWFIDENSENLAHAMMQALLKRGVPRELFNDNGSPMISAEFRAGLTRLGIQDSRTLAYSPYQNGKCEFAWTKVDGRLMAMLENYKDLTLQTLNDITQAWMEMEYNRQVHRETNMTPVDRFSKGKDVGRTVPSYENLRQMFRRDLKRKQRRSDGTVSVRNQRFEIPSRFRNEETVTVRFAEWDLSFMHLIDFRSGEEVCRIYPVDKAANADGKRKNHEEPATFSAVPQTTELPPLLKSLVDEYAACGMKPAYLPKTSREVNQDE